MTHPAGKPAFRVTTRVRVFEQRVLTYMASNSAGFQVEMGNIGQFYYRWRYCGA